jgi:hypothetical protein
MFQPFLNFYFFQKHKNGGRYVDFPLSSARQGLNAFLSLIRS